MTEYARFYDVIPNRKVELIDQQLCIAGSLDRSAVVLHAILAGYGAAWAARRIPRELLRQAVEEV